MGVIDIAAHVLSSKQAQWVHADFSPHLAKGIELAMTPALTVLVLKARISGSQLCLTPGGGCVCICEAGNVGDCEQVSQDTWEGTTSTSH